MTTLCTSCRSRPAAGFRVDVKGIKRPRCQVCLDRKNVSGFPKNPVLPFRNAERGR